MIAASMSQEEATEYSYGFTSLQQVIPYYHFMVSKNQKSQFIPALDRCQEFHEKNDNYPNWPDVKCTRKKWKIEMVGAYGTYLHMNKND